jgi:hypothetical protein
MTKVFLVKSATKKWRVIFDDGTHVDFGAKGYSDYTIHKDPVRKARYIIRHRLRENWTNSKTAGFWSRWLLWEKPTLKQAANEIKRRFGISVSLRKTVYE